MRHGEHVFVGAGMRAHPVQDEETVAIGGGRAMMLRPSKPAGAPGIRAPFHPTTGASEHPEIAGPACCFDVPSTNFAEILSTNDATIRLAKGQRSSLGTESTGGAPRVVA